MTVKIINYIATLTILINLQVVYQHNVKVH